jgi:hypothetical protein
MAKKKTAKKKVAKKAVKKAACRESLVVASKVRHTLRVKR